MTNLTVKDLIDAFSGVRESARDAMPTREQLMSAVGAKPADDMMSSFGIFAAGIVLGAGLAVLFTPRPGSEVREAIGEKISNLRTATAADA
jgi:hypothetical protein